MISPTPGDGGDFPKKLAELEEKFHLLSKTVFSHGNDIREVTDEVRDMKETVIDLSDLVTGKLGFYPGSLNERDAYRRMQDKDSDFSSYKYVFGNAAVYEDEYGNVTAEPYGETYGVSYDSVMERIEVLEQLVRDKWKSDQARFECVEKKLDACLDALSEVRMEEEILIKLVSDAVSGTIAQVAEQDSEE